MILWGWGQVLRLFKKDVYERTCDYCHETSTWRTCIASKWFTIFFIPIIPYSFTYRVECPHCKSYQKLTKKEYDMINDYHFE